ncbi:Uncharacterised protein [Mycobacteroides abscessus subsp. abscessus]|nr:Uncharacterised protein [Mycobacteroides abscessus subsp. abscessus]
MEVFNRFILPSDCCDIMMLAAEHDAFNYRLAAINGLLVFRHICNTNLLCTGPKQHIEKSGSCLKGTFCIS